MPAVEVQESDPDYITRVGTMRTDLSQSPAF